ncbi:long-chain-fatty-acid--CoA ligase [Bhargavaea massiliensis]|uniref:long-chain-fatty-acid--CoA ligase n=1 Tax=Bhargavaea massiliensis TaxID=2697500 RepID=UPI001BCB7DBB|nr:long-chain fatty acid--CoA ligase [Bhargavaea massiliensis]
MNEKVWLKNYPEGIKSTVEIPDETMVDAFYRAARQASSHPALIQGDRTLTYAELKDAVHRIANGLKSLGLQQGDRVALMMNNSIDYVISYYAILASDAIAVPHNPMYTERELHYQLNDSGASYLIIDQELAPVFKSVQGKTGVREVITVGDGQSVFSKMMKEQPAEFQWNPGDRTEEVALLQYTGGTTGVSKGVMLTHRNIYANVVQTHAFLGVHANPGKERLLNVLPLFHVYGMTVSMNYMIYLQSTMYIMRRFDSTKTLEILEKNKITMFPGTPTIYVAVNHDPAIHERNIRSIHTCISGSAPLPAEVKQQFEQLTGAKVADAYGLSEASPVTHSNPVNGIRKAGSMGMPVTNTDCRIVDIGDGKTKMPIGKPGELIIRGPQVMKGYWNKPDETEVALRDGWLYTGDVAYMDEDGYCFIVSRKKEMIIASGYNIYPREIEEVIFTHPMVREVAVIGIPDEYRGETVKAFVVLKEEGGATEEELIEHCKGKLAKYKIPTAVEIIEELPKTTVGKILRRELVKLEQNRHESESQDGEYAVKR